MHPDKTRWLKIRDKFLADLEPYLRTYYNLLFENGHEVPTSKDRYGLPVYAPITKENFPFKSFIDEAVKDPSWSRDYAFINILDDFHGNQDIVIKSGNAIFTIPDNFHNLARAYKNARRREVNR